MASQKEYEAARHTFPLLANLSFLFLHWKPSFLLCQAIVVMSLINKRNESIWLAILQSNTYATSVNQLVVHCNGKLD